VTKLVVAALAACVLGMSAAESEIPQATAEKIRKGSCRVNVAQVWTRNLLGDDYGRYVGWPTVTRLRSGELVAVFSGDREGHVCPYGKVMLIRSKDSGETWSKPVVVCDGPIDDRDAGLLELTNGDLVLFWFTSLAFIEYKSYYEKHPEYLEIGARVPDAEKRKALGSWTRRSQDGGKTWSQPVRLPVMTPHGGRQLRDGRILVVGLHNSQTVGVLQKDRPQEPSYFAAMESTDGGRSFREIGRIERKGLRDHWSLAEPSFVEAPDGTLTAYFRYELAPDGTWSNEKVYPRHMYRSVSKDGGRTWTNMTRTELDGFPPHFLDLGNGRVLCSYGSRTPGRTGIYAAFSSDGGKTFDVANECCIYRTPFEDCGYPSTVRLDDGSFLTVFYAYPRRGVPAALTGVKWRLSPPPAAVTRKPRWELLPIYGGGYVQNVVFTRNPKVAYMTIDVGGPYRSDDGCLTWRSIVGNMSYDAKVKQLDHARSISVDPRDENNIICAAGNGGNQMGGIVVSRDGGTSWRQTAVADFLSNGGRRYLGQVIDRNPWDPDELIAGANETGLVKTSDNGENWRPVGLDRHRFTCIHYDRAVRNRVWACAPGWMDCPFERHSKADRGQKSGFYRSDDGGETWNRVGTGEHRLPLELVQIVGRDEVVALIDEEYVIVTRDGGRTWSDFSKGLPRLAKGVGVWDNYGCQSGRCIALGAGQDFYLMCDTRGNPWRRGAEGELWVRVKNNPPVCSEPDKEMRSYNSMPAACSIVVNPHDQRKWYITDWYSLWESVDAGTNWHSRIHGAQQLVPFTFAASPFDPNTLFYATADSSLYQSWDGGESFQKMKGVGDSRLGESVNSIAFSRLTPGLVMVTGGKFNPCVRVSRDNGRNWAVCSTNGLPTIRPDNGWTKKDGFYSPYSVYVHPKANVFYIAMGGIVGKGKGGIYRTRDLGESWEWFGEGLSEGEHMFKFCEWGCGYAMAISESGDMMCWDMGGNNVFRRGPQDGLWTKVGFRARCVNPLCWREVYPSISAVPGRPGEFMANCGNDRGWLHRSYDGGRSFVKVEGPSGYFSPLAFDERRPGHMIVGGNGDLYVSRDYGAHFEVIPEGMAWPSGSQPSFCLDRGRIWAIGSGTGAWRYHP